MTHVTVRRDCYMPACMYHIGGVCLTDIYDQYELRQLVLCTSERFLCMRGMKLGYLLVVSIAHMSLKTLNMKI